MSRPAGGGSLAAIVRALGGELYEGGRRAMVPGVGHSRSDRSVSLLLQQGRVVAHSFAGDDWRDVLDDLRARGLIDVGNRIAGGGSLPEKPSDRQRAEVALRLWSEGRDLAGTLAERHLGRRCVRRGSAALRFHPAVPAAVYLNRGVRRPALLAAIQDPRGHLVGIEVTYLAPNGETARMTVPRKTVGRRPTGAAVRLDPAGPELVVGEGVFTCLSASEALSLPVWALLAVANLRTWTPPQGVTRVVIAGDHGAPGERGAAALVGRLRALSLDVELRLPPAGFADWNDAARGRGDGGKADRVDRVLGDWPPAGQEPDHDH